MTQDVIPFGNQPLVYLDLEINNDYAILDLMYRYHVFRSSQFLLLLHLQVFFYI